jgi:hypothetical protein
MNEDMLRAMIRESVARHLGERRPIDAHAERPLPFSAHASHFRYTLPESGGPCFIEPNVGCNHCGFCESHGH